MSTALTTPAPETAQAPATPAVAPAAAPTSTEPVAPATPAEKPAETKAPEGAPEKYESFTLPEGMTLEGPALEEFQATAKEMKLPQAQAQKLVDLAMKNTSNMLAKQQAEYVKVREGWINELKADPTFGGANFDETVTRAMRSLTKFGSPKFNELLDQTGLGDNPEVIRMLAKIDKMTGEDKTVDGTPHTSNTSSAAKTIYPNMS